MVHEHMLQKKRTDFDTVTERATALKNFNIH